MPNPACPDKATLELLLLGKLSPDDVESWSEHFLHCDACGKMAETISANDDLTASIRARKVFTGDEEILAQAIVRAKALRGSVPTDPSGQLATTEMRGQETQERDFDRLLAESSLLDHDINFLAPAEQPDELGRLGGYRILEVLGVGGMGLVFRAEDPKLERLVALKVMKPTIAASKSAKDRFLREAKATAALEHHNIVQIYQVGEDRGVPFIAMQYLRGESLQKRLSREKKLGQREVLRIGREVADGLEVAHERGLIHRDIKPDNIWLDKKTGWAKILDFGLARATAEDTGLTQTGAVLGTPRYMAPEQAQGQAIDYRCDLFSLGNVLYHLAAGQPAFDGNNLTATLIAVAQANPQPIAKLAPMLHPDFARLIMRLLAKERDQRPQSAADVSRAIAQIEKQLDSAPAEQVAPTIELRPKVDRSRRDRNASSHGVTRLHSRSPVFLRGAVALAAIAAFILCGAIIIKITGPDGTVTEIKVPGDSKVELTTTAPQPRGRTDNPVRPATPSPTTTNNGDPTNMPDRIVRPTAETPTPSTPASDFAADRAAAEWALSFGGTLDSIGVIDAAGTSYRLTPGAPLPASPFQVFDIIVNSDKITDAAVKHFLPSLKRLRMVYLTHCSQLTDAASETFSELPALTALKIEYSGMTDQGILTVARKRPLSELGISADKFTPALADFLATSTVRAINLYDGGNDAHLRLLQRATNLDSLGFLTDCSARHATWASLSDHLPNLRALHLSYSQLQDADVAALSRLSKLEILGLAGNLELSDAGLERLAVAANLKTLDVTQTAVTPLGVSDFLEAKPECQVLWDGVDHRAVAEWVWSVGGKVQVAGLGAEWLSANVAVTAPRDEPKVAIIAPRDEPRGTTSRTGATSPTSPDADQPTPNASRKAEPSSATGVDPQGSSRGAMTATLRGPVLLTGVDLSGLATLKDADLARLADCTTLRDLQLHNSSLTGACLTHLKPLTRLRTLSLAGLPIEDQELALVGELKQLQTLELNNTKITDEGMPSLTGLTELFALSLNGTAITTAGLESVKRLPKLVVLDLQNTSADDRTAELLCEFPSLRSVGLSNTRITEAGVKRLAQRSFQWNRLFLSNLPTVTDAVLTDLRGQRELITLELGGTSVTPAAFEAFVREHPRLGMTLPTDNSEAPDLRVARRVLAAGGEIVVEIATPQLFVPLAATVASSGRTVSRVEDLQKEPFRITAINLSLDGAKATDETLAEVGRLEALGHFSTADVAISNDTVAEIAATPKLVEWHLTGTPLSAATVRQLATTSELTALYLHNTSLDGPSVASLAALTKLQSLDIGSNPLTDDDIALIEKLTELAILQIGTTQIVNHGWASIAKLPKLKELRAYNMPVTDEALRQAGQIESLELLNIGGAASEVGDAGLQHLRSLRHLRELQINHCRRITDAGAAALAELPALETLYLNATPITDAGLKHVAKIKTLKSLDLTECQLSDSAIDDLQDALPWCRIQRPQSP